MSQDCNIITSQNCVSNHQKLGTDFHEFNPKIRNLPQELAVSYSVEKNISSVTSNPVAIDSPLGEFCTNTYLGIVVLHFDLMQ